MKITKNFMTIITFLVFTLFFGQNLLLFITVFIWSYPSGFVTISTNNYGEMIFEIIMSGIITILSFIGIIILYRWERRN